MINYYVEKMRPDEQAPTYSHNTGEIDSGFICSTLNSSVLPTQKLCSLWQKRQSTNKSVRDTRRGGELFL